MVAGDFVRQVVPGWIHRESQRAIGVIAAGHALLDGRPVLDVEGRRELVRLLRWFEEHLPVPARFNRTTSKGWYRRDTRGISWLRATAQGHVAAMEALADFLVGCGHRTAEIRTSRVGYVVYEDDVQIVAEPFRDTPTE